MLLRAAWVVPVAGPPIRDGFVALDGPRIAAVGAWASRCRSPIADAGGAQPTIDLGPALLTPGLVNPHTHLELGCYHERVSPAPFWPWILRMVQLRREPGQLEREQAAAADWAWRSLRLGVTCIGDISRRNVSWRALRTIPIRKVCFVELLSLADDPPRDIAELQAAISEVVEDELLTVGVTPHAPYSVPAADFRAALALAAELGRPWCTHWAETREECDFLRGDERGLPEMLRAVLAQCHVVSPQAEPIAALARYGRGLPAGALAHVNYIDDRELDRLAGLGHTVMYCPRAHRFFGHAPHPLPRLRRAGVRVVLATDSPASNEGIGLLDELRFVHAQMPDPPTAAELLRMGTLDAAAALGLDGQIGSLETGKFADLAAFECGADVPDPLAALLNRPVRVAGVWVAGRRVL